MAIKSLNSAGGFGLDNGTVVIDTSGNVTATNLSVVGRSNLGIVSNVIITGGSNGQFLSTDGLGNLTWTTGGGGGNGTPGGSNTQVQFNDAGAFGANSNFTFNKANSTLSVTNIISNGAGLTNLTGANVTGQVGNALVAGTVYASSQSNITSVGTLTGLTSTGTIDLTGASNVSLGSVSNVKITGGSSGKFLTTDGLGNLSWASGGGGGNLEITSPMPYLINTGETYYVTANHQGLFSVPIEINGELEVDGILVDVSGGGGAASGSNTQVQFNDDGAFGASSNFTFNSATNTLTVTNIAANGSRLTNLTGANVSGQVSFAATANSVAGSNVSGAVNLATFAGTANSVAGANVSGQVSFAATANSVAGANVSGQVSFAATANSVAGSNVSGEVSFAATANSVAGANVSGAVNLATFAGTANSVAGANVSGAVNLATFAGTANSVAGANVSGAVNLATFAGTANSVAGSNVSGQVGNALVAGTVYSSSQPNITSVGTLTLLSVTGNITSGNASLGNLVSANFFSGNGSSLSSLTGANVSGQVSFAATANSVAGSNVLGEVSFAGTANSVAGANVSGQVSNALVAGTVYTAAQPNITSVGTLTLLSVTGNITSGNASLGNLVSANFFSGSGNLLSNIQGSNVIGTVSSATTAGTVTTAAQPNITSLGTLSSVTVSGNANVGNLVASGTGSFNGNVAMNNFYITGLSDPQNIQDAATKKYVDDVAQGLNIHDSCAAATTDTLANITGGTVTYNNGSSGVGATLTTTGTINLIDGVNVQTIGTRILVKNEANAVYNGIYTWANNTTIVRATDFDSVPEVESGDFTFVTGGTQYDNTGWVQTENPTGIGTAGNNISFTQFSGAGTYLAGTGLTLTGSTFSVNASQTQITSVGTLTGLQVNGNIIASNITANTGIFAGNGSGLTNLTGANVSGQVGNALVAGTVYASSQSNITSVGTLTGLTSTGTINFTSAGNVRLGPVGNVKITGGSTGQFLSTDGLGNLSWSTGDGNLSITSPMPFFIDTGETFYVTANHQGLFSVPIEIDGVLEVDGVLVDVNSPSVAAGSNTQVQFNAAGVLGASSSLTYNTATSTFGVPNVSLSGNIIPTTTAVYTLGDSTHRWAEIYTSDLSLSNEAKGPNDVDGTTGNWTIQEGAEDLFIINNKSGKKYRFVLSEIDPE